MLSCASTVRRKAVLCQLDCPHVCMRIARGHLAASLNILLLVKLRDIETCWCSSEKSLGCISLGRVPEAPDLHARGKQKIKLPRRYFATSGFPELSELSFLELESKISHREIQNSDVRTQRLWHIWRSPVNGYRLLCQILSPFRRLRDFINTGDNKNAVIMSLILWSNVCLILIHKNQHRHPQIMLRQKDKPALPYCFSFLTAAINCSKQTRSTSFKNSICFAP